MLTKRLSIRRETVAALNKRRDSFAAMERRRSTVHFARKSFSSQVVVVPKSSLDRLKHNLSIKCFLKSFLNNRI